MTQLIITQMNILQDALEGLVSLFKDLANELQRRRNIKDTIKQLSALTTHELNDIGIARSDIWYIAHTSFPKGKTVADVNPNLKGWI